MNVVDHVHVLVQISERTRLMRSRTTVKHRFTMNLWTRAASQMKSQTCWWTPAVFFCVIMSRLNQGCGGARGPGGPLGARGGRAPAIISSRGTLTVFPLRRPRSSSGYGVHDDGLQRVATGLQRISCNSAEMMSTSTSSDLFRSSLKCLTKLIFGGEETHLSTEARL